jgi:hypothetical protein
MVRRDKNRVHLPLAPQVAREPRVAEGARSLSSWSAVRRDLAARPELLEALHQDPIKFLATYGITGTTDELAQLVAALTNRTHNSR